MLKAFALLTSGALIAAVVITWHACDIASIAIANNIDFGD